MHNSERIARQSSNELSPVTRRLLFGRGARAGAVIASAFGAGALFTDADALAVDPPPTSDADSKINCIPNTKELFPSFVCQTSCIGGCTCVYSYCYFNTGMAPFICGPCQCAACKPIFARAVCVCHPLQKRSFCCCKPCVI